MFEIEKIITLNVGEDFVSFGLRGIGTRLLAGTRTNPGKLIEIDLTSFTETKTITLDTGYIEYIINDSSYIYLGTYTGPGNIYKLDINSLAVISTLPLSSYNVTSMLIIGNKMYVGYGSTPSKIGRVDLSTFTEDIIIDLGSGYGLQSKIVEKDGYIYCAIWDWISPKIVKLDMDLNFVSEILLSTGIIRNMVIDNDTNILYGCDNAGYVIKIDLNTFSIIETLLIYYGYVIMNIEIINKTLYAFVRKVPSEIVGVDLDTFTIKKNLSLDTYPANDFWWGISGIIHQNTIYTNFIESPSRIAKVLIDECPLPPCYFTIGT